MPCDCEMHNGVMRVWADESREEELWAPPGTSTEFFSGRLGSGAGVRCVVSKVVWPDESREEELWAPPGTSTEFFSGRV